MIIPVLKKYLQPIYKVTIESQYNCRKIYLNNLYLYTKTLKAIPDGLVVK